MATATKPILVVEDDEDIRDVMAMALGANGYAVELAADGLDAIQRLSRGLRPALILLDMMMPRMDGEAFLCALHERPEFAQIPVVLLSGHSAVRQKAAELHTSGYLVKPIQLDDLLSVVTRFVAHA